MLTDLHPCAHTHSPGPAGLHKQTSVLTNACTRLRDRYLSSSSSVQFCLFFPDNLLTRRLLLSMQVTITHLEDTTFFDYYTLSLVQTARPVCFCFSKNLVDQRRLFTRRSGTSHPVIVLLFFPVLCVCVGCRFLINQIVSEL